MQEDLGGADEQHGSSDPRRLVTEFALHVEAARLVDPVQHALGVEAAGVAAEETGGGVGAPVIAHPGMTAFGDTVLHRLRHLERIAESAAGEDLHLEAAIGQKLDALGEGLGADVHQRAAGPGGRHLGSQDSAPSENGHRQPPRRRE